MWLLYHLVMLKLAAWCHQPQKSSISDLCIAICEFWKYVAFFILHCIVKHMMTSSNGNIFRVTGHLCREFTGPVISPHTSFDVFFVLRLNKRLSKQSWGSWFEMLSHPSWRHRNDSAIPRQSASGTQHYPEYWKQIRSPIKCLTEIVDNFFSLAVNQNICCDKTNRTVILNPYRDKLSHVQKSVVRNCLSIPKLQRLHRWSLGTDK